MSDTPTFFVAGRVIDRGAAYYGPDEIEYCVYRKDVSAPFLGPFPTREIAEGKLQTLPSTEDDLLARTIGWLRRRQGNDLVMMSGNMARDLADHLEQLANLKVTQ